MDDTIYTDGSCLVNPGGPGGWGFVFVNDKGIEVERKYGSIKKHAAVTNNFAEYMAVLRALQYYQELGRPGPLKIRSDSKMLINQLGGTWKVKEGPYRKVWERVIDLLHEIDFDVNWEWVPREQNEIADGLSKKGSMGG